QIRARTPVDRGRLRSQVQRRAASSLVSSAAGTFLHPPAFWPDHSGDNSPLPCVSALDRSGTTAAVASGNAGAAALIGPSSAIRRLTMPRAGRPVKLFVSAVCFAREDTSASRCTGVVLASE